jgi:threonine/homoserine/homoserine lactone efflux protein
MTIPSAVGSFAVVAGLVTLIPGLDTALVLRSALARGRRQAFATAFGISTGALLWGVAAAMGISALLTASELAFTVVRIAGAAYMIVFGCAMIRASFIRRPSPAPAPARQSPDNAPARNSTFRAWTRGLTTNLLNPKVGVFYIAMLPQFIPQHASHLMMGVLLAGVHDVEALVWFSLLILAGGFARPWLRSRAAQRTIDRVTGSVLIGFGLKLALSEH